MLVTDDGGETYTRLNAAPDGSYTAVLAESSGIVVAITGDANGDGRINAIDAMLALRASADLVELDKVTALALDVTGDGFVGSDDARLLLRYSIGMTDTL